MSEPTTDTGLKPPARDAFRDAVDGKGGLVNWRAEWRTAHKPTLAIVLICWAVWIWQMATIFSDADPMHFEQFGLSRQALLHGRWWTLFTSMWMHGPLWHIIMNCGAAFALGRSIQPYFSRDLSGSLRYLAFFIVCGLAGGVGFLLVHLNGSVPAAGMSGALFGVAGGVARLDAIRLGEQRFWSRHLLNTMWRLAKANIWLIVYIGILVMLQDGQGGIAWEAHLFGFLAGALIVGWFVNVPVETAEPTPA